MIIRRIIETLERRHLLNESLGIVYHTTRLSALLSILETRQFRFMPASSSELWRTTDAINKTYTYFMSFSRSKHGGYNRGQFGNCTLVVDHDWLRSKVRFAQLDYFGDRKSTVNETEERALSNTQYLKLPTQIRDVILEIHIWIEFVENASTKEFMKMMTQIKLHKIPYYIYTDRTAWYLQRKDKATHSVSGHIDSFISRTKSFSGVKAATTLKSPTSFEGALERRYWEDSQKTKAWLELYHQTNLDKLSPQAKLIVFDYIIERTTTKRELEYKFLKDTIHRNPEQRNPYYEKLFKIVRKMKKTFSPKEIDNFLLYLTDKWSRILAPA